MSIYKKILVVYMGLFLVLSNAFLLGVVKRTKSQGTKKTTSTSTTSFPSSSNVNRGMSRDIRNTSSPSSSLEEDIYPSNQQTDASSTINPANFKYSDYRAFDAIPKKCVVGSDGYIYLWIGNMWQKLDNKCSTIAVAPLAINSSGKFYIIGSDSNLWIGSHTSGMKSLSLNGNSYAVNDTTTLIFVTVAPNGDIWCIGSDFKPYRFDGSKFISGYSVPSGLVGIKEIAITTKGESFVIGTDNWVYKVNKEGAWARQEKIRSQVVSNLTTDSNGNVWCIGLNDHQINWFLANYTEDFYWGQGWGYYDKVVAGPSCTWAISFSNDVNPNQEVWVNDSNPSGQDWHAYFPPNASAAKSLVTLSGISSGVSLRHIVIQASRPTNKLANFPKISK